MTDISNQRAGNDGAEQAKPVQPSAPAPRSPAKATPQLRKPESQGRRPLFRN
jgi:hypothetical protein